MPEPTEPASVPRLEERPAARGPSLTGEWLFQRDGQVFGPVRGAGIVALLASGAVTSTTRVRREAEPWRPLAEVAELRPWLEEWQARARMEAEARSMRARERTRSAGRWAVALLAIGGVVAIVVTAVGALALKRPWERRSALLEGFELSVTIGSARVAGGTSRGGEIAVPEVAHAGRDGRPRGRGEPREGGPAARAPATPGGAPALVATGYDPALVEQTVARSKESLAPCLREEAERSGDFTGEIPIEFAVGNDGKVAALWIDDPRFRSGALRECLLAALRRWSFTPFEGQRPVVSLSFHVGRR